MPHFTCNLLGPAIPFAHFWEHTVGSDHAPMALRADWQAQLARCHRELGFRHVRFHGLLSDRMGTLMDEEHANARRVWQEMGEPKYLSRGEVEQLQAGSCTVKEPLPYEYKERVIGLNLGLPPHGVAAITIELASE